MFFATIAWGDGSVPAGTVELDDRGTPDPSADRFRVRGRHFYADEDEATKPITVSVHDGRCTTCSQLGLESRPVSCGSC